MRRDGIAIIGDKDSVLAFKAIGVSVYSANTREDAEHTLKTLARTYKVIFITEELAAQVPELLKRYKTKPYPIVIPVPSANGSLGIGIAGIKSDVEKAIGTDIIFKDN